MTYCIGDKVEIIERCGARFFDDEEGEFYEFGEKYTVIDVRKCSNSAEHGLRLKENARLLVPFEAVKKVN